MGANWSGNPISDSIRRSTDSMQSRARSAGAVPGEDGPTLRIHKDFSLRVDIRSERVSSLAERAHIPRSIPRHFVEKF